MSLSIAQVLQLSPTNTNPKDLSTPTDQFDYVKQIPLAAGTGADQADMLFHDQRTVGISSNDDLDLAGGLTDPLTGATMTFVRIRGIWIFAAAANTNNLTVGNGANPFIGWFGAAAHTESVRPGGMSIHISRDATGWPVTAATADILRIANGAGTTSTYDILIIGCSV